MTTTQTNEEIAFNLYSEAFGEKSAKRNAKRIAVLAALIAQHGAQSIIELEEIGTDMGGAITLKKDDGVCVLGQTNATTVRVNVVIARFKPRYARDGEEITYGTLSTETTESATETVSTPAVQTTTIATAPRKSTMRGQIWEECYCGTEPVCAACENCNAHCTCGGVPQSSVKGEIYGGDQSY